MLTLDPKLLLLSPFSSLNDLPNLDITLDHNVAFRSNRQWPQALCDSVVCCRPCRPLFGIPRGISFVSQPDIQVPRSKTCSINILVQIRSSTWAIASLELTACRYEFWYDVVAEPEYTFKIGRLHKQYGIVQSLH